MTRIDFRLFLLFLVMALVIPFWAGAEEETPEPAGAELASVLPGDNYVIGPGDILDISVWKDEALTKSVTVLPDGTISFPLIGQVHAGGKTVAQLKSELEKRITRFVPDPVLSIGIQQVNSMWIYVIGRVNGPGRFAINANVNVLQALSMAGGFNPFAKRNKVKIFRNLGERTQVYQFRYDDIANGTNLEQNIWLKRGDVIVVP